MAFCKYCGTKLEDGQVCTCAASTAANATPVAPAPAANPYAAPAANPYAAPTAPYGQPVANQNVQPTPAQGYGQQAQYQQAQYQQAQYQQTAGAYTQNAQGVASENVMTPILNLAKGSLKNPIAASEEFYAKATVVSAAILLGAITLVYMLAVVFSMLHENISGTAALYAALAEEGIDASQVDMYLNMMGMSLSELAHHYGIAGGVSVFEVLTSIFYPIVYVAAMLGGVIGSAFLVNGVFLKRKTDIRKVIVFSASVSLPLIVASVATILANCIGWIPARLDGLAVPFKIITVLAGLLTVIQGLNILNKEIEDRKKLVLTIMITVGILCLLNWSLCLFMNKCGAFFTLPF